MTTSQRFYEQARARGDLRRYHLAQRLDALTARILALRGGVGAQVAALRADYAAVHKQWADTCDQKGAE